LAKRFRVRPKTRALGALGEWIAANGNASHFRATTGTRPGLG
jgi:hypothetical protein